MWNGEKGVPGRTIEVISQTKAKKNSGNEFEASNNLIIREPIDVQFLTDKISAYILKILRFPQLLLKENSNSEGLEDLKKSVDIYDGDEKLIHLIQYAFSNYHSLPDLIEVLSLLNEVDGINDLSLSIIFKSEEDKLSNTSLYTEQLENIHGKQDIKFVEMSRDNMNNIPENTNNINRVFNDENSPISEVNIGYNGNNDEMGVLGRILNRLKRNKIDGKHDLLNSLGEFLYDNLLRIFENDIKDIDKNIDRSTGLLTKSFLKNTIPKLGENQTGIINFSIDNLSDLITSNGTESGETVLKYFSFILYLAMQKHNLDNKSIDFIPYYIGDNNFLVTISGIESEEELGKELEVIRKFFESFLPLTDNGRHISVSFSSGTSTFDPNGELHFNDQVEQSILARYKAGILGGNDNVSSLSINAPQSGETISQIKQVSASEKNQLVLKMFLKIKNYILLLGKKEDEFDFNMDEFSDLVSAFLLCISSSEVFKVEYADIINIDHGLLSANSTNNLADFVHYISSILPLLKEFNFEGLAESEEKSNFEKLISIFGDKINNFFEILKKIKIDLSIPSDHFLSGVETPSNFNFKTDPENAKAIESFVIFNSIVKEIKELMKDIELSFGGFIKSLDESNIPLDNTFGISETLLELNKTGDLGYNSYMKLLIKNPKLKNLNRKEIELIEEA